MCSQDGSYVVRADQTDRDASVGENSVRRMISCENVDFDEGDPPPPRVKMYIKETSSIIDAPSGR